MKKKPPKKSEITITLTAYAADDVFVKMLRYWDEILKPRKDDHVEDVALNVKRRNAIKVLLEYMSK